MRSASVGSYLLLRRHGGVWGVANEAVLGIGRQDREYHVQILGESGAAQLLADEVLGVVDDLKVWPPATVLRRFWQRSTRGMAVHAGVTILVVDPDRPPPTLLLEEETEAEDFPERGEEASDGRAN